MSADVGSAVGYLDLDISGFLAGLQSAQDAAGKSSKNIVEKIGGNLSSAGKSISSAGKTLTKNVTTPLLGIGFAGLKVATDFEKGMSEVKAISGATGKDFDSLREKAIELGADTAFSANEVAAAMTEMAKAGWGSQQIIDGMGGVLAAAAASGEGLATTSTIVADTITGFGMAASDSTKVADLLTQAANSGTIGITDLGESFKYIAPVAGAMGLSVEDVTTAISAMSMAGIKGSQAGTSLRTMLTRMVKPTDDVAIAMDELGISVTNQDGSMKSLDDIVSNLRTSFDGLTESEKAKYAATLAGQEGMAGMLSLLNLTEEEYNEIAKSMDNAGGVAEKTAAIMQDNLQSKVEQLGGSLESLAIKMADCVIPSLQQFVGWLTGLVDKFTALSPETQKTILAIAGIAAAIGPVLFTVGKFVSGIGGLFTGLGKIPGAVKTAKTGFTALKNALFGIKPGITLTETGMTTVAGKTGLLSKAFAALTSPVGIAVAAIAVLGGAFISLWKNNESFRNNITAIWDGVKAKFESFSQGIADRLNALGFNFTGIVDVLKAAWEGFCDLLAPIFEGAFSAISAALGAAFDIILGVLDIFIGAFTGNWGQCWEGIKGVFSGVWNGLVGILQAGGGALLGVLDVVCGWFGTTWSATWSSIKSFFSSVWTGILSFFSSVWNSIKSVATGAINGIKSAVTSGFNAIKSVAVSVWNGVKTAIATALNAAKGAVSSAVNGIKSAISSGFSAAKSTVSSVFGGIKSSISNIMNGAASVVSSAIDRIKGFFNFSWSLPHLSLPHFSISGSFSLSPPSVPKISVDWYKKAMGPGMILDSATIFGYDSKSGKFLGGGEAGSEVVVGTRSLMSMISKAVFEAVGPLVQASYELAKASADLGYVTYNGFTKFKEVREKQNEAGHGDGGHGDTFVFYSPKAIDEIEAAKQMKKTKRELAEGF